MKKLLPIVFLAFVASAAAQTRTLQFIGDKSKLIYYPLACIEARQVNHKDSIPLFSADEAKEKGYTLADTCSTSQPPPASRNKPMAKSVPNEKAVRLIEITSNRLKYYGTKVTVVAGIKISTNYRAGYYNWGELTHFSFSISDGTDTIWIYMRRGQVADRLRTLLLDEAYADEVIGRFTIYFDPERQGSGDPVGEFLAFEKLKVYDDQ